MKEIEQLKEQFVVELSVKHQNLEYVKNLLEVYEENRLRQDKVQLLHENARLRRENEGLIV